MPTNDASKRLYPPLEEEPDMSSQQTIMEEMKKSRTNLDERNVRGKKSLLTAYLLWFIGGWFGLHHMYLNRDDHAFIYIISFGAYFGCGWFRDIWKLPEYVRDANDDQEYLKQLVQEIKTNEQPPNSWARSSGYLIIGDILGYLIVYSLPNELLPDTVRVPLIAFLVPLSVAIGVHLVGNVGRQEGQLRYALFGAYITTPLYYWNEQSVFFTTLSSFLAFNKWGKKWRRRYQPPKSFSHRFFTFSLALLLYFSLWSSWLYFNCTLTDREGQQIKCREAARHFLNSPFWKEFKSVMHDLYQYYRFHGLSGIWSELISSFDPTGEFGALKVLGLNETASQDEITATYRRLSRTWHPDRHRDPKAKEEAAEKFMEIQAAYEILSKNKHTRMKKNKISHPEPTHGTPWFKNDL